MGWTISNNYLTQSQMDGNAAEIFKALNAKGWSVNAIAGFLGNAQRESTINPGIWQNLEYGNYAGGFGLVQWTPATNYINWANANGYSQTNPDGQLKWIDELSETSGQWIQTSQYQLTWTEFKKSTASAEWLASAFLANFERAGVAAEEERKRNARYYFEKFSTKNGTALNSAIDWAVSIANDNSHGYDQANRWGPDYDCSSLIITAWQQAGVKVKDAGATFTGNMYYAFIACGFEDVTEQITLSAGTGVIKGDVLLNIKDHTAMSVGNGQIVQASQNEFGGITGGHTGDQTNGEIHVRSYYNYPWDKVLRYSSDDGGDIPTEGVFLTRWIPD